MSKTKTAKPPTKKSPAKKSPAKKSPAKPGPSLASVLALDASKLPPSLASLKLPPLQCASGALDAGGVLRALVGKKLGEAPLFALVRSTATAESRDALAVALLRFWETKDFHGRYDWVLDGVIALGGEESTIVLAEYIAAWPGQSDTGRKRAIQAIPALVSARTDAALLALLGLRQTAVVPSVLEAIILGLERAVELRQTSLSELFDAITPTFGLDARGERTFDYGPRSFTAAFDDHFEPRLVDASGERRSDLPEPEPGDDVARANAARGAWTALSAQLREAVKVQTFRLEQDMVSGRRWDAATWSRCLKEHPLLVSFTRRVLWGIYDEGDVLVAAFRTAEDQSLVGHGDTVVQLDARARIGVVHPLHLDESSRTSWAASFADYEIISPFPQLGRAIHRARGDERAATATTRFAATRFKSGVLRDILVRKGWTRDPDYVRKFYQRTFERQGVVAIATLSPGIAAGEASYEIADQTIPTLEIRKKTGRGKSRTPMPLGDVPAVAFSEALLDLGDVLVEQDAQ